MKDENIESSNFLKNKKFIYSAIVLITLFLYYEVRKDEDNLEKLKENNKLIKNKKEKEDKINFENSKLLNMEINKENIKKLIFTEKEKEDNNKKINDDELELWKIETFFLTLFCAIYGGLYYYAYQEEKNNNTNSNDKEKEKTYLFDDYTKYLLDETEFEFLINKDEKCDYNYL